MNLRLNGLIAATHTPTHPDGSLNLEPIPQIVEHLLSEGVRGIFVCGTTGEGASFTADERRLVAEHYVNAARRRMPVIVHVGHNALHEAQALAAHAASVGADAIAASPPNFFRPANPARAAACLEEIARGAPQTPIFYYHIPAMSGVEMPMTALLKAAESTVPAFAGVKYTHFDLMDYRLCVEYGEGKYQVPFGRDQFLLGALAMGATSAIGSTYNFAAPVYLRLWETCERGEIETARQWQDRANAMIEVMVRRGGVAATKAIMGLIGIDCGPARLPLALREDERDALERDLRAIGFFEWRTG